VLSLGIGLGLTRGGGQSLAARLFAQGLAARFNAADLVGSNGSSVTSWSSRVGSYTASGGTSPTLRTSGNSTLAAGWQAVRFTAASSQYLRCDALAALFSGGAAVTIGVILRRASNHDGNIIGIHGAGSLARQHYIDNFSGGGGSPKIYNGAANPSGASPPTRTTEDAVAFIVRNPGGTSYVWANGQRVSFSLSADANSYTGAALGAVVSSGTPANFLNADLSDLCVWSRALADHDIAAATLQMGASGMVRFQAVALGDSITAGTVTSGYSWFSALSTSTGWASGASVTQYAVRTSGGNLYECTTGGTTAVGGAPTGTTTYTDANGVAWRYINIALPSTCLGLASSSYPAATGINRAVSGRTLMDITGSTSNEYDNLAADITGIYEAYVPRIVFVFLGTNDLYYGASDSDAETRYWTVVDAIPAANPRDYIVAVTPLPRGGGVDTTGLRSRILAGYAAHCDAVWDAGAASNLQNTADTAWYSDGIHPTVRGQTELLSTLPLAALISSAQHKVLGSLLAT
jgi:lysophospholipase L1-like esterase